MFSSFVLFFRRYMLVSTPFWYRNRLLQVLYNTVFGLRLNQQTLEWWFMNGLGVHLCWLEKVLKNCRNVTHPASIFWRKQDVELLLMFDLHYIVVFHKPLRVCTDCAIITSMWVWNKRKVSANQKTSYCNASLIKRRDRCLPLLGYALWNSNRAHFYVYFSCTF